MAPSSSLVVTVVIGFLAACSPSTPPAVTSRAVAVGERAAWEDEWERVVAAARQEGSVAVVGPQGDGNRRALTEPFEKKYGISVDYLSTGGPELPPRVINERAAGIYSWDVFIAGTTTLLRGLKPNGALQPLEPALILPEVAEPRNWRGGELPFMDSDRLVLSLLRRAGQYFYVNTNLVRPEEFGSWRDLLDPKWKGKLLVGRDPSVAGYGRAMFLFFYLHPELGPAFVRDMGRQELQMMRDDRTAAQWLAQGRVPLCFCSNTEVERLTSEGLPVAVVEPSRMREGTHTTSGPANLAFADRPAHPNAAKLYINWVLSREGSTLLAESMRDPSTRADVLADRMYAWAVPDPAWPVTNTEQGLAHEESLLALLTEVFGRQEYPSSGAPSTQRPCP